MGIFGFATDKYSIVPHGIKERTLENLKVLKVPIIQTSMANSVLIGVMAVGNSSTLFVPYTITEKELIYLKEIKNELGIEIVEVQSKLTALGNLMLINDKGALISDKFEKKAQSQIIDVLPFNVEVGAILGSPLVGTMAMATNKGVLIHPMVPEEEKSELESVLHVKSDVCTVNKGVPYPRIGIIANSKGAIVGNETTGPEMMRIFEVLFT